jgi:hypothetical protein
VHNVSDVRHIDVHISEPLVPSPNPLEVELATAKLKKNKSPGSDQILVEVIQVGGEHNCLISGRSLLSYQFTKRMIKLTATIIVGYHCYQLHTKCSPSSCSQG